MPTTVFPFPYTAEFIAKVALEACAHPHDVEGIAHRYCVVASEVEAWRRELERKASSLYSPPAANAAADLRVTVLEQMEVCIAVLEGETLRYRYANASHRSLTGDRDIVGMRLREVFPQAAGDGMESGILRVLQTGESWEVKNFHAQVAGLGETVWEGRIERLPLTSATLPAVVIWIRDVTASAHVESSLRTELALLRAIGDNSADVMFAKDRDGRMRYANPAALALIGKPFHEVQGKTDIELLVNKDVARLVMENDRRIMDTGKAEEVEETVPMPDGTRRIWLSQKRPFRDQDGKVTGLLGVSRDITERKDAADKIQAAHDSLQRVLDSITDGLAILDKDWRYTYFSETGARMLGVRSEDLIGRCLWDLFPHAEHLLFGREYRRAVDMGVATHFEEYYPAPLNVWLECHCYPSSEGLSVYFRDVTDRRHAQDAAAENERRIKALLEATPVGLTYANAGGEILVMNNECKRIWGNPPATENVDAYAAYSGWWADQSERHGRPVTVHEWPTARALRGERVHDTVIEIEPFDMRGTRRTVLHRSVPVQNDEGAMLGAVTAMMDLTDFVQVKRAVVEGHHRIQQLANTIPQLAWMADQEGLVHWYNERWLNYTGLDESEMTGWNWACVHDPAVLPQVVERWKRSLATGEAFEMTFPIKGKDGRFRPFYVLAEPLKDLEGHVQQWFGTCTDVSALQQVQEDLKKTQAWLQEGLDAGSMVAWECDCRRGEVRYSDNVAIVLGHGPGTYARELDTIVDADRAAHVTAIERAVSDVGTVDQVTRRIRPDNGATIWVRMKGSVFADQSGDAVGIRGILVDITEQVLREHSLEEANNRKDEFLAMLAHELRNPLAPIATAAQLLTISNADAQRVRSSSEIIARQVGHMTRLIDDLLDVSRVTRGLVELEMAPVPIKDVVSNAIEQARPLIEVRKHQLSLHVDSRPAVVLGDRVRLCQILVNLLNNAAKYTPQGGKIGLDIAVDAGHVHIVIEDNGIGIDRALLPHVFELFTQATRTPDRSQGGLGLGLSLVHSLVGMHGGSVRAFSAGTGKGSRFSVTLPLVVTKDNAANDRSTANWAFPSDYASSLSILIVDDNSDAADMLAGVLRVQGHSVRVEYTSQAAMKVAGEVPSDLYILDIGLPDFDGYELVRRLRSRAENAGGVFVALTGYGQAHDKVLSLSAGFDHHLVKPVNLAHLEAIIRSLPASRRRRAG
ncbi:PAS domain-containing protein [Massilia sp. MS-15]|nr:PAS domain-containing protein [Massilia sp. MS-15]